MKKDIIQAFKELLKRNCLNRYIEQIQDREAETETEQEKYGKTERERKA